MKKADIKIALLASVFGAICFFGSGIAPKAAAADEPHIFDSDGGTIFKRYDQTPESYMSADSGDRNLMSFYELRQYPGSPPRIPHTVKPSFDDNAPTCISCHGLGGFSPEHGKFIPVTPHPDNESCRQCHVPQTTKELFVESNWVSIDPPVLGRSSLGGSPPPLPHSLQLREDCIACHTGPGSVTEIRVEHSSRGNCRQCHVPMLSTAPIKIFQRNN